MVVFDNMTEQLQEDYLDRYKGAQAQMHQVSQFDESSDLSTTYLNKVEMSREDALKAQEQFSLVDQSTAVGTLQDDIDGNIPLDSGATMNFMLKHYYLRSKCLHWLPKSSSRVKII